MEVICGKGNGKTLLLKFILYDRKSRLYGGTSCIFLIKTLGYLKKQNIIILLSGLLIASLNCKIDKL